MDKSIIFEKVKLMVSNKLKMAPSEVTVNTNFTEYVKPPDYTLEPWWHRISSMGYVDLEKIELIMEFEEEFDIEISDEAECNIKTVQQVVDYIYKKLYDKG